MSKNLHQLKSKLWWSYHSSSKRVNLGYFGFAVNMDGDGDFIYIASGTDTNYTGATFVYRKNTTTGKYYEYQPKLVGTPHLIGSMQNFYGISVTSSGSLISISSPSGAYWIFALNGTFSPSQSPTTSHPSHSSTSRSPTVLNGSSMNSQDESLIIGVAVGVSSGVMLSIALGLILLRRKRKFEQVNLDSTSLLVASNRNFKPSLVPIAALKSEDPEQPSEKIPVADVVDAAADSNASNFLFFFSYARVDTSAETAVLYDKAKIMFPNEHVFRDSEHFFKLDELIIRIKRAKNCLVLLSYNYPRRPFTLVELHVALEMDRILSLSKFYEKE